MGPAVHERGHRWLRRAALSAAVLLASAGFSAAAGKRDLTQAVYEFAVTGYCGTQDAAVQAGFRAEVAALTPRGGFDAESVRRQRIRGWVAAEERSEERRVGEESGSKCKSRWS